MSFWPGRRFRDDKKIEIERFSLTSSKPFDQVVLALNAGIGHPNMSEFARSTHEARSFAELKSAVEKGLSKAGLMLFMQLDQGAVVQKETGQDTPRIIRLLIGNPLIMKEMGKHVPDAGSYAPITVLVDERADGVHLSYDRMASFLATETVMRSGLRKIWTTRSKLSCAKRQPKTVLDFGERFPETLDFNFFSDILFCRVLVNRGTSVAIFRVPRMFRQTGFVCDVLVFRKSITYLFQCP